MPKFEKIGTEVYHEVLDNGLNVYIVEQDFKNTYATFSTKYGSIQTEFSLDEVNTIVPDGIAHFLEHKMFEQEDGVDPFQYYSKNGIDANANTNNTKTTYLFSGYGNFIENLNYLIDYVQAPYFTDENVEKEKGIIEQEIKMYLDRPGTVGYEKLMYNALHTSPYKIPIIGTIDSIRKITKEDLYTCYNAFYHPSNMILVVTGGVNAKEVIEAVKKNQNAKTFLPKPNIKVKEIIEEDTVFKKEEIIDMSLAIPKVAISFKINNKNIKLEKIKKNLYLNLLLDIKFSTTSEFNEKLLKEETITDDLYAEIFDIETHTLLMIFAETKKQEELLNKIITEMKDLKIDSETFERKKNCILSSKIKMADSIFSINSRIVNNLITFGEIRYDIVRVIEELNYQEMCEFIETLNLENYNHVIIK